MCQENYSSILVYIILFSICKKTIHFFPGILCYYIKILIKKLGKKKNVL